MRTQTPARKGFTLIELMLSVAVVAILFSAGISAYVKGQRSQAIKSASEYMLIALQSAQKKSLIGDKDCGGPLLGYQVAISSGTDSWVITPKCEGADGTSSTVKFDNISFEASQTILFQPLGAGISLAGGNTQNIDFTYGSSSDVYRLTLTKSGSIAYEGKQP